MNLIELKERAFAIYDGHKRLIVIELKDVEEFEAEIRQLVEKYPNYKSFDVLVATPLTYEEWIKRFKKKILGEEKK